MYFYKGTGNVNINIAGVSIFSMKPAFALYYEIPKLHIWT